MILLSLFSAHINETSRKVAGAWWGIKINWSLLVCGWICASFTQVCYCNWMCVPEEKFIFTDELSKTAYPCRPYFSCGTHIWIGWRHVSPLVRFVRAGQNTTVTLNTTAPRPFRRTNHTKNHCHKWTLFLWVDRSMEDACAQFTANALQIGANLCTCINKRYSRVTCS